MTLNEIKAPVEGQIKAFETLFRDSIKSNIPLLNIIMRYIVKRKGKQMRPLFVFFSAGLFSEINDRTLRAATLIEMLHTATLIHDDVVDDSNERRGFFSLNALWKNKISVLVGDFLLSRGLILALENDDFDLLKIVSHSVREMSEGELLQIEKARTLDIEESVYFEIIRKKTASLIASCLASGTAATGASADTIEKMRQIGEKIGIAFQIKDDILDFDLSADKGKPSGVDIKERKMTLPLIFILNKSSYFQKRKIINIVKNHNTNREKVDWLMQEVVLGGGIEYAVEMMTRYRNEALEMLEQMPDRPARESLRQLIDFTIQRKS
ncbi:MAG: polyprenyl synthetase family protein [Bacteroidales bacterium]|jgi:octaprenyl-diphosphate synthase|nr:polyprenyl synthetase family protein [Bacteroidales bacterium]NLM92620.1 polyprenyl synthetase family protein [Bacteroidales bacterium]